MATFSAPRPAHLSLDARHLLNVAVARRDYVRLAAGGTGLSAVAMFKAATLGLGVAPIMSATILMGMSAYVGLNALRQARGVDHQLKQAAPSFSSNSIPAYRGLMPMGAFSKLVQEADQSAPSLVAVLANRRRRSWDKVMEPGYQPQPLLGPRPKKR